MRNAADFESIHIDDFIIVVNKPSGLLAVPGRGEAGRDNLASRVQARFADALVVHRLDQHTSGLMVLARGLDMQRGLNKAFAERQVHKRYEAVVEGQVEGDSGQIDAPLMADWPRRPLQMVNTAGGKPSLTEWRLLSRTEPDSGCRLSLQPVTGRSHQLRVHLQHIGHPIRGDDLYAPQPLRSDRLLLHACELRFAHPDSGAQMSFSNPAPF